MRPCAEMLSAVAVAVFLLLREAAAGELRLEATPLEVGACPATVVPADVDEDGRLDLLVANHHSHDLSILVNGGAGGFSPRPRVPVPGHHDSHALSLAVADYDEDGHLDVATASFSNDEVLVFRGDGSGGLPGDPLRIPVGDFSLRLVSADLDGDGHGDLAVANRDDDTVAVLIGDGQGGFKDAAFYPVGGGPTAVEAADLDGDGDLDLVSSDSLGMTATVLAGDGGGAFVAGETLTGFSNVRFVLAADPDGDGAVDLAVSHGEAVEIPRGRGDGTFASAGEHALGSACFTVAAADLDEDGALDLAAPLWDLAGVAVLAGDGAGGFAPAGGAAAGRGAWGAAAADLDGDGHVDIAVTGELGNDLTLLLNRTFDPVRFRRADANADGAVNISDPVDILNHLFGSKSALACRAAADVNADRQVNIADPIYELGFLFLGGPPPKAPYPDCAALDPAADPAGCAEPAPACAGAR